MLILWMNTSDPKVVPLLIHDVYHMHMIGSIVNCIQALGIEVQHIWGGCTYLCQPVDVGINLPITRDDGTMGRLDD